MANSALELPSENMIIGGDFDTNPWQRGISFAAAATGTYGADRMLYTFVGTGVVTIAKAAVAPTVAQAGMLVSNSYQLTVTTNDAAIGAASIYAVSQKIEGYNWAQLAQRPCTLSFWVYATVAGIYCISLRNSGNDQCYVAEYTIAAGATWQYVAITIPASPAAGTWFYDNRSGVEVAFCMAGGANFQGVNNTWNAANVYCTANQVNNMATNANVFRLSLIQLTAGTQTHSFVRRPFQTELLLCKRYYQKSFAQTQTPASNVGGGDSFAAQLAGANTNMWGRYFPVNLRAQPTTFTTYNPAAAGAQVYNITTATTTTNINVVSTSTINFYLTFTGDAGSVAGNVYNLAWTAEAEL